MFSCAWVEEDEHGAHGNHVEATRHFRKQQTGGEINVKCKDVKKCESKDDQRNDQIEVLERVPKLSIRGVDAAAWSATLDEEGGCDDNGNSSQN